MGGFKNKKSRSKVGNSGGRPAGKFARLDEQEKRDYINDAVYKHRYGTERPKNDPSSSSSSDSESENESSSVERPLNLVAMSPNKLRVRMSFLNSKRRKKQRLSEVRRASVANRWSSANADQENHGETLIDSDTIDGAN